MISEQTFRWGLHSLNVAFNREPNQDAERLYRKALEELTEDAFRAAVHEVIQSERFFPPPAVLLEAGRLSALRERAESRQLGAFSEMVCGDCDGTKFQYFERGGHTWVRRCDCRIESLTRRKPVTGEHGMLILKQELRKRGMDLDSLVAAKSMPGTPTVSREPGSDDE